MPEQAAAELKFKTEEDRQAAFEALQARPDLSEDDLAEIERIQNAPVDEQMVEEPVEEDVEPDQETTQEQPADEPAAESASAEPPHEERRDWHITEDIIRKYDETYTDRNGRVRPTFLAKDPEAFIKSAADSQKYIRFLESKKLPDAENAGYERAKREMAAEMERMRKALDAKPAPAPAQQQQQQEPRAATEQAEGAEGDIHKILAGLNGVDDDDLVDHVPTLVKGLAAAVKEIGSLKASLTKLDTEGPKAVKEFQQRVEQEREQQQAGDAERKRAEEQRKAYEAGCQLVDQFVASADCPATLKMAHGMHDATREAVVFHNILAELFTGKNAGSITNEDVGAATTAYLAGQPELAQKVRDNGIPEPQDYRKWIVLDQVDALRTGMYRDPQTKQWRQRYDQATGRPVQFPDAASAYRELQALTGQDKAAVSKAVTQQTQQMVQAIQQRDKGVISMDESRTHQEGQGGAVGQQQAVDRLAQLDELGGWDEASRRARQGNREMLDQYNAALAALGHEPIPEDM